MAAAEVGPQRFGHVDFRVRDLPQQVIADTHFAAGADQEVRIGLACRVEKACEALLVELLRPQPRFDGATGGIHDLRPPRPPAAGPRRAPPPPPPPPP